VGLVGGLVLGIILVAHSRITVAIIGIPDSTIANIITIILAAGNAANVGSFIGAWFDLVFAHHTIFHAIHSICTKISTQGQADQGEAGQDD
jgi:hypothetical protein